MIFWGGHVNKTLRGPPRVEYDSRCCDDDDVKTKSRYDDDDDDDMMTKSRYDDDDDDEDMKTKSCHDFDDDTVETWLTILL